MCGKMRLPGQRMGDAESTKEMLGTRTNSKQQLTTTAAAAAAEQTRENNKKKLNLQLTIWYRYVWQRSACTTSATARLRFLWVENLPSQKSIRLGASESSAGRLLLIAFPFFHSFRMHSIAHNITAMQRPICTAAESEAKMHCDQPKTENAMNQIPDKHEQRETREITCRTEPNRIVRMAWRKIIVILTVCMALLFLSRASKWTAEEPFIDWNSHISNACVHGGAHAVTN